MLVCVCRRVCRSKLMTADGSRISGQIGGAVIPYIAEDIGLLSRVLTGKASQRVSNDVAVMKIRDGWVAAHVQPEAMD